jgi:hypothetical protein
MLFRTCKSGRPSYRVRRGILFDCNFDKTMYIDYNKQRNMVEFFGIALKGTLSIRKCAHTSVEEICCSRSAWSLLVAVLVRVFSFFADFQGLRHQFLCCSFLLSDCVELNVSLSCVLLDPVIFFIVVFLSPAQPNNHKDTTTTDPVTARVASSAVTISH